MPDWPMVNWQDPHEACKELRRLDTKFQTETTSPLHHDKRCALNHGSQVFEILDLLAPNPWRQ